MEQRDLNLNGSLKYGGGEISDISADQMKNNILAIQQLINSHNLIAAELKHVRDKYDTLLLGSGHILNRVDIALLLNGLNVVGTIIVAVGVNLVTDVNQKGNLGPCIIALGAIMVLGATIFHLTTSLRARS